MTLNDVSLLIATFNEEESINFVLNEIKDYGFGEIIIIDGNSSDKTIEIASNYDVKILTQAKPGWGSAVKEGLKHCTKKYITYIDGDGSYNPKSIIEMRNLIKNYDAVFCSRYKDGHTSPDDTPIRALGNKIFTFLVRSKFKCEITDSLFFYPMLSKELLNKIDLRSNDFTLCLELPAIVHKKGLRYTEILSIERERYSGISKVNAITDGFKILLGILKLEN